MSLEDLNKDMYDPKSEIEKRGHERSKYNPLGYDSQKPSSEVSFKESGQWQEKEKGLSPQQKKAIKIGSIIIAAIVGIILLAWGFVYFNDTAFEESRLKVEVTGPDDIGSSELATYKIKVKNDNRARIKNAELTMSYSDNFKPESNINFEYEGANNSRVYINEIGSHSETEVEFKGRFYAPADSLVYIKASLNYMPSNFNSTFKTNGQLGVNINSAAIDLNVTAPVEILNNNTAEYIIKYKNPGSIAFDDVRIKAQYPDGFTYQNSEPSPFEGNDIWLVGRLDPGQEGELKIQGNITGSRDDAKSFKAILGIAKNDGNILAYNKKEVVTKVVDSPLVISYTVNGKTELNANAGDNLEYLISYRNDGEVGLRNIIVNMDIDSPILDYSKLKLKNGGFYDGEAKTITWKAPDVMQLINLEPGQGGEIEFSIPIKSIIEVDDSDDKNFVVDSVAKIDSPDVVFTSLGSSEASSNKVMVKLNSKVILEAEGYYNDPNLESFGPIPPEPRQETSYVMHWKITNISNDLRDVEVRSFLPTGIKWNGKIYPEDEDIKFNERTNEIVWKVGSLKSGTGILDYPKEISFQIGLTPQDNQAGSIVALMEKSVLTAIDAFTSNSIKQEVIGKTTQLSEDLSIGSNGYKVKSP